MMETACTIQSVIWLSLRIIQVVFQTQHICFHFVFANAYESSKQNYKQNITFLDHFFLLGKRENILKTPQRRFPMYTHSIQKMANLEDKQK